MAARIVIQHLTGPKANQIEQFPLDGFSELTIGRDPSCTIAFDPQRDDFVSRRHALIRVEPGDEPQFKIADLGSRNGTLVNGETITAETELLPGDTVELGSGGPKFTFDLQPRPANAMARTRIMSLNTQAATRILNTAEIEAAASAATLHASASLPPKTGVGRDTVIGMLATERAQANRSWMYVLAGVLVLVAVGGGGLYYYNKTRTEAAAATAAAAIAQQAAELDTQKALAAKIQADAQQAQLQASAEAARRDAQIHTEIGMSPAEIVRRYGNATVQIDLQWRLYDKPSGKPLYQKMVVKDGRKVPAYVGLANGKVVRWLTTDDENQMNSPIGVRGQGSGFVIGEQGFILTNKHVAAGWLTGYGDYEDPDAYAVGAVFDITHPASRTYTSNNPRRNVDLYDWTPEKGVVFRASQPVPVDNEFHDFEGRSDLLEVRFPGSTVSVVARFVRASPVADVAEIKIDTEQSLTKVDLSRDGAVQVGDKVTVLGYPGFSTKTFALIESIEGGAFHQHREMVPQPTVTDGLVSLKSGGQQQVGDITTIGRMGEVYQLTAASSHGNSGGPVFNDAGKVIGVFTYGTSRETVTYAVPIKFGIDLLRVQASN
ncbi:MAG: trypsin-like peptidase domain-containing protein [Acetobacteraceae bacterium]|nr:trypsin-like peptidase domain-containing protein [Acetobacteraceae bacterium]